MGDVFFYFISPLLPFMRLRGALLEEKRHTKGNVEVFPYPYDV